MSKARIKDFEEEEFYQVPKWLIKIKGLQPADILIYMLARNNWKLSKKNGYITENEEVFFYLTHESLKEQFDFGKNQIIASLKRLIDCGVLIAEKVNGKATKYFIENDIDNINFDITSLKKGSTQNQTTPVTKIRLHQSGKSDYHQSGKGDINNTELNKTKVNNTNTIISELEKEEISQELRTKLIEFIAYRKEIKKPIQTYRTLKTMIGQIGTKFLNEAHLMMSIDDSIANQYQGVFPIKIQNIKTIPQESYNTRRLRELEEEERNARKGI